MNKPQNPDNVDRQAQAMASTEGVGAGTPVPGGQIGPYKLLQPLGEGGFATVYLARQQEPVRREVAVKIVKAGMDSASLIARFEAERQALALLSHPNIARVFDAGTTQTGRPFFVMEYIKGIPITEHCDSHKLSIEERLVLFLQVCDAVQHAHQKGIIHRDIKPSNILVSLEGSRAAPKVIDFGIAKAVSQPLTERTLHTELGQLIGTPEYMSPEQADMTSQDIDTRTDVYSLGVVLYELLSGTLPFESDTLRSGGLDHVRQVIREQEPRTPSTRLRGLTDEQLTAVTQRRRTDAKALPRRLRGDLDWITLKAMDKDRARRYGSVGEFMADIGRHLHCEPVTAGPPSTVYRVRKFIRRHRTLVAGLTAVAAVLIAGIAATSHFAIRAEREGQTSRAVADFLTRDLLGLVDPNKAKGGDVSVRYILDGASASLQGKFQNEPRVEASIRQTLGDTYVKLGEWRLAQPHFERVVGLRRRYLGENDQATLDAMTGLAQVYMVLAQLQDAERLAARVLEITRRLHGSDAPSVLTAGQQLAYIYVYQSQFDKAEPLLKEMLETSRRRLGETHVQTISALCGLANLYYVQGRKDDARSLLSQAMELQDRAGGPQNEFTLSLTSAVALQYAAQGRHAEAQAMIDKALEACRRAFGDEHRATLSATTTLSLLYETQGRIEEAKRMLVQVLDTSRRVLGEADPFTVGLMEHLGALYRNQGRYAEAEPLLLQHLEARRDRLGESHPNTLASIRTLVDLYDAWGKPEEARKWKARLPPE